MTSADFARTIRGLASHEILIPTIHAALYSPSFAGFDLHVDSWVEHDRQGDGWFHPSMHSLWTVRQLYSYLVAPQLLERERMPLTGIFAVTAGTFWHKFLQRVLLDNGLLIQDEVPIEDIVTNRRGHADGVLRNGEALEIKTINNYQIGKVISEEVLREKKPQYWAQTQDYLDVLGIDSMRYLMLNPDYPFVMKEFVVRANKTYQAKRRVEYVQAIELAQKYPDPRAMEDPLTTIPTCCAPRSTQARQCVARKACPIGKMSD